MGTVRINKKGLPKDGIFYETGQGKRRRGEMKCMARPLDIFGQYYLYFTAWMNSNPVHILHITKPFQQTVQRTKKETSKKETTHQPTAVADYNFGMQGTDGINQMISYYRKTCDPESGNLASLCPFGIRLCAKHLFCSSYLLVLRVTIQGLHYSASRKH